LGVFVLIITHYISFGWYRKKAIKFANFEAISKATRRKLVPKSNIYLIFKVFVLVLLVFSLAGMGIWYNGKTSNDDYMF